MPKRLPLLIRHAVMMAAAVALSAATTSTLAGSASAASSGYPAVGTIRGELNAVAATSLTNAWAVGGTVTGDLAMRWDGNSWKRVRVLLPAAPSSGHTNSGVLRAVAATSVTSAWAVGTSTYGLDERHCTPDCPQIVHWNGNSWQQVRVPIIGNPAAPDTMSLNDVAATSARNVWVVGSLSGDKTLILHWDGKSWRQVPSPKSASGSEGLSAVTALTNKNAWAVGNNDIGPNNTIALVLHWDGKAWKEMKRSASLDSATAYLTGVAAASVRNIWAVGHTEESVNDALIEHWNGKRWNRVPSPSIPFGLLGIDGVTATRAAGAWALNDEERIEHWNGDSWKLLPSPQVAPESSLYALAATSACNVWVVGSTYHPNTGDYTTVILRWNGKNWGT